MRNYTRIFHKFKWLMTKIQKFTYFYALYHFPSSGKKAPPGFFFPGDAAWICFSYFVSSFARPESISNTSYAIAMLASVDTFAGSSAAAISAFIVINAS